jgi:integrase
VRRRAPGEGSIRKRKDGRWEGTITVGHTDRGNPRRIFVYGRTRTQVVAKLEEKRGEIASQGLVLPEAMTVAAFLARWLEAKARRVRPSTLTNYRETVDRYLIPLVGHHRVQKLSALHVNAMLTGLAARTVTLANQHVRRETKRPISTRLVRYIHSILVMALEDAVRWRLLRTNPAAAVERPRAPKYRPAIWTGEEVRTFLAAAADDRYFAAFLLMLVTGMRRGELLGLRVSDLAAHLEELTIRRSISAIGGHSQVGEPKSERGRRTMALPAEARVALRVRLKQLAGEREIALEAGLWEDGEDPYLFGIATGRPTDPRNFLRHFTGLCGRAGVRRIRLHDLRHTYGSHAIARLALPDLSARLGHYDPAYTASVYLHEVPGGQGREAALSLDQLLRKPKRAAVTVRSASRQNGAGRKPN